MKSDEHDGSFSYGTFLYIKEIALPEVLGCNIRPSS
jgi:hypothetical protein